MEDCSYKGDESMQDRLNSLFEQAKKEKGGVISGLIYQVTLIFRLMRDPRVNPLLKALPIAALIYLLTPIDLFPINPLDDGLVLWLGGSLFITLCPQDIVQEHKQEIRNPFSSAKNREQSSKEVIEGQYKDVSK
jgi:uncharacterized membrane protein YkvA (DUF1232 family)